MNLATLCHDEATSTWSAEFEGSVLVKSVGGDSSKEYVIKRILEGRCAKAINKQVTGFVNLDSISNLQLSPGAQLIGKAYTPPPAKLKANNLLTVEERYELLDESVRLTAISKGVNGIHSLIITGEGSVGKTFHTKQMLKDLGLLSTEEAIAKAMTLTPEEQVVADQIWVRMLECRQIAVDYYKENGLPKKKKPKVKEEPKDDESEEEPEEEPEEEELLLPMDRTKVNFTELHTSRDIKERCTGGRYGHPSHRFWFNIKLAVQNPDEYYNVIVPHEVAHQIQYVIHGDAAMKAKEGHGREWCEIMKNVFELDPSRYINPDEIDFSDVRLAPDLAGDYHYVKGYSSAKGLYRILFENKHKIVVLDDCDAAWQNEVGANILKGALDTDEDRWISWNTETRGNDDLPRKFLFEGKVIFVSNVKSEDFPQPLQTRALRCDVSLTMEECFERMRQIMPSPKFAPGIPMEIRQMAYDFLWENRAMAAEISTRALLIVTKVANTGSRLWKRIALSNIT